MEKEPELTNLEKLKEELLSLMKREGCKCYEWTFKETIKAILKDDDEQEGELISTRYYRMRANIERGKR